MENYYSNIQKYIISCENGDSPHYPADATANQKRTIRGAADSYMYDEDKIPHVSHLSSKQVILPQTDATVQQDWKSILEKAEDLKNTRIKTNEWGDLIRAAVDTHEHQRDTVTRIAVSVMDTVSETDQLLLLVGLTSLAPTALIRSVKIRLAHLLLTILVRKNLIKAAFDAEEADRQVASAVEDFVLSACTVASSSPEKCDIESRQTSKGSLENVPTHKPKYGQLQKIRKGPVMSIRDENILERRASWLSDSIIDTVQLLLSIQCPEIEGFQSVCTLQAGSTGGYIGTPTNPFIQILNVSGNHWVTVSNIWSGNFNSPNVKYYDSLPVSSLPQISQSVLCTLLYGQNTDIVVQVPTIQKQRGGNDCGLFAIANATALAFGTDPCRFEWNQSKMRQHLKSCINKSDGIVPICH